MKYQVKCRLKSIFLILLFIVICMPLNCPSSAQAATVTKTIYNKKQTILDKKNVTVKLNSINKMDTGSYSFKLQAKNNRKKAINWEIEGIAINGKVIPTEKEISILKGKTGSLKLTISKNKLKKYGIKNVRNVKFHFAIWDHSTGYIEFYAESDSTKTSENQNKKDTFSPGKIVLENKKAKVYYTKCYKEYGEYVVLGYVYNKTSKPYQYSVDDIAVNGKMVHSIYSDSAHCYPKEYTPFKLYSSINLKNKKKIVCMGTLWELQNGNFICNTKEYEIKLWN